MPEMVNLRRNGNGQSQHLDVELLVSATEKKSYCTLFKINGESRSVRLSEIVPLIKVMEDPCFYIDRSKRLVDLRECKLCQPEPAIYPHRIEVNAASFFPSKVDSDAYAIRVNCIKSAFSDSLQLLVLFTERDDVPELVVQSLAST